MIRLLHTSDWHLGDRLGTEDRLPDQLARLEEICAAMDRESVDVLMVAGDVFDESRAEPFARVVRQLAKLLKPRIEAGLTTVFIAGNHDREYIFPLLSGLQDLIAPDSAGRVIFADKPRLAEVTSRSNEQLSLLLLPYPSAHRYDLADQNWASPDEKRAALASAVRDRIRELGQEARDTARGQQIVLCGHFLVRGVTSGLYRLTEQEDVPVEPSDLPTYAYIALGHIHKPQILGAPHIRYCGSIERMDRGEEADQKHVLLVDVAKSGLQDIREIALDATPFATVVATSEEDLQSAADGMPDRARALVSLRLRLRRDQSLRALQSRARELFPRIYAPTDVEYVDRPQATPAGQPHERQDVPTTVRRYLEQKLAQDPDAKELRRLAEELLATLDTMH
ncbi:MAG: exonuclease SbcCD subunit D [Chloroflexota bacterium]|nr:exonuclease SbcCD subunit D [Chloroflexota bacterium]